MAEMIPHPASGTQFIHVYPPKRWITLLNLAILIILAAFFGVVLFMYAAVLFTSGLTAGGGQSLFIFTYSFAPILICLVIILGQMVLAATAHFRSYIKTTPEGIEEKVWPYRHVRARWSELDHLGHFLLSESVYLSAYGKAGPSLASLLFKDHLYLYKPFISLSAVNGWPDGQLVDDIKMYAPHLFSASPESGQAPLQGAQAAAPSQNDRILAALSHAAYFLPTYGVLVPMLIYFTQKRKTSYPAFQALQAFIYQIGLHFLFYLYFIALIGLLFLVNLITSGAQAASSPHALWLLILGGGLTLILVCGVLLFGVYALIGAVSALAGKDFHYPLIGKRLARRKSLVT